ncbi:hypothetical protein GM415_04055 [Pseudodesulfovibrio cashew]|uniref:Uncharacterized protein n=1 Tax=Pseudodesulfovibrio cashew TaxID=2678688 RepID=A0A6I6J9L1_9BACT|nr:hypothetical protein [Pseudodesulfovibrio cashew]QGY39325.1 hypothetical protein GM415_04055 [Pseudodesulfovibrio cashew]
MAAARRKRSEEWARNIILILCAVGAMVIFFNLDIVRQGDSVFNHTGTAKLYFRGDLTERDFSTKEVDRLRKYVNAYAKIVTSATVETTIQDRYKGVTPQSEVIFEVRLIMRDGARITTPARRAKRSELVRAILLKLDKDIDAYRQLKKEGKEMKGLVNTS